MAKKRQQRSPRKTTTKKVVKRNELQRNRDRDIIAAMYLKGVSMQAVLNFLNRRADPETPEGQDPQFDDVDYTISKAQIYLDLKAVRRSWAEAAVFNFDEFLNVELDKLDLIEQEAWSAWEKSKNKRSKNAVRKREIILDSEGHQVGAGGDLIEVRNSDFVAVERMIASQIIPESPGDPRYLNVLIKVQEQRVKLLGDTYALFIAKRAKTINAEGEEEDLNERAQFIFGGNNPRKKKIRNSKS